MKILSMKCNPRSEQGKPAKMIDVMDSVFEQHLPVYVVK